MALDEVCIGSLLGSSQAMGRVRAFARKAARVNVPVLILGETGTGKSLLGRVIHQESPRASRPYLAINCAGIPGSLFESEFFGHQRGAFTGAREGRRGIFEQAQGGSLFLDEVGELSVSQQAKLLTALEEGEIRRLGGEGTVRVDVRLMAATSRDLVQEMRTGAFRRELFHRLAVLVCRVPPLRARREDIPVLARRLLRKHQERHGCPPTSLSFETQQELETRFWPGNVRELSHVLEAALVLSDGGVLGLDALRAPFDVAGGEGDEEREGEGDEKKGGVEEDREESPAPQGERKNSGKPPRRYAFLGSEEEEREFILSALARARGNKSRAAMELGMARNTLRDKLRKYRLS